jgi:anti-sigma28 factor (negative regulator of flagellin synthesis)
MDAIRPTTPGVTDATSAAVSVTPIRAPGTPDTSSQTDSVSTGVSAPTDQILISHQGTQAAKYVEQARAVTPLDEKTIKALKAAIAKGNYPAPALIQGLVNLVGIGFADARKGE